MTTPKRLEQKRRSAKKKRAEQKKEGRVGFTYLIKPEWRKKIMDFIKGLEAKAEGKDNVN